MNSRELVARTIRGENHTGVTPKYGWVRFELQEQISRAFGSVENFEDHYRFDLAHIFGGPFPFDRDKIAEIRAQEGEFTPEMFLDLDFNDPFRASDWESVRRDLEFYQRDRGRFTYLQSYSMFEPGSAAFGFENQLLYMAMYPDEMKEFYRRMADWAIKFAQAAMDLGVDMVHLSDDWGSQRSLIFSEAMFRDYFHGNLLRIAKAVKERGVFLSLHSDGYIYPALPTVEQAGFDVVHPWQENAGMTYGKYLDRYADSFAIMGGVCVQSTFGFGNLPRLKAEIERVFGLLRGKRWICCTSHFVDGKCSMEELIYGFDLIQKLSEGN